MKKNVFIIMLLFVMSIFSMELVAQENLNALVKKCETMSTVDVNVMSTKNPETKELLREIFSINIKENPSLVNEFIAAFKKDEINALKVIEDKKGGKLSSLFYQFENATYSFQLGERDKFGFTVEKDGFAYFSRITALKSNITLK